MSKKLRIFLVDDHVVVREGLRRLVEAESDMEIVGEAAEGAGALERAPTARPDVVIMDVSMRQMSGSETTRRLKEISPEMKILALTVHEEQSYVRDLLEAGASGYILKRAAAEELIGAIRSLADGHMYVDPAIVGKLVTVLSAGTNFGARKGELSEREEQVMRLIAQGYTNKDIAVQLSVSIKTVETHKARSMEKLGLSTRVDIIKCGIERGWLEAAAV